MHRRRLRHDDLPRKPDRDTELMAATPSNCSSSSITSSKRHSSIRRSAMTTLPSKNYASFIKLPSKEKNASKQIDAALALVYFCNVFAITIPIVLTPMIAKAYNLAPSQLTSFSAAVASVAMMGGGVGKIINGIVCQRAGGITTASYYLLGLGFFSFLLSLSNAMESVRWLIFGMEFCSSALWVACSLILSNHYSEAPLAFARGVTYLSLASTSGQLLAKTVGAALLQVVDWRIVARLGGLLAVVGSMVMKFLVSKQATLPRPTQQRTSKTSSKTIISKVKAVISRKFFWMISLAHVPAQMARSSDRMLGPFLSDITAFPYQICSGLTTSITIGFVHGLTKAQSFYHLKSIEDKKRRLKVLYAKAGCSMLGLAFLASEVCRSVFSPAVTATLAVFLSAMLASSTAFQFYQIPNLVSSVAFAKNKAICLAFVDGLGFFLTAPIWGLSSHVVQKYGWSATWIALAGLYGVGGTLMVQSVQSVLITHPNETN